MDLENYKYHDFKHKERIDLLLKNSYWRNLDGNYDEKLNIKMRFLIENCLNFSPGKRINFKNLNKILKQIDKLSLEEIGEKVFIYVNKPHGTKEKLKEKIIELEAEIKKKEEEIKTFAKRAQDLTESLDKRFEGSGTTSLSENSVLNPLITNKTGLLEKMLKWNSLIIADYNIKRKLIDFALTARQYNSAAMKNIFAEIKIEPSVYENPNFRNPFDEIPLEINKIPFLIHYILSKI